jgi:isopenicillin-N epimerase
MTYLKEHFLLDPTVIFLNHGSFGATPEPVFAAYQEWQRRLERQPVLFLGRELDGFLYQSRQALGEYLGVDANDLVYIPNATHGVNIIARSLALQPGDEVLATDHEYGACDYTWEFVLSHVTSPTALRLPVGEICQRARQAGILTVVDGAHAPGQIPLDLVTIGADFYTGNCHKWMMAPKGAAFLYARREVQHLVEPLIVSWGTHATPVTTSGSQFIDYLQCTGTKDPAAALAVPAAIQFMHAHNWDGVRRECHSLLRQAIQRICELTGLPSLYPLDSDFYAQMGIAPLPSNVDAVLLKKRLYNVYKIEVPLIEWNGQKFIRISVQGYNTQQDVDALVEAMEALL